MQLTLNPARALPRLGRQSGMTLIELLVVLVILTLVAGLIGPQVLNQLGGAKTKTAAVQIKELEQSLDLFKLDVGRYPSDAEGLRSLVERPGSASGWSGSHRNICGCLPSSTRDSRSRCRTMRLQCGGWRDCWDENSAGHWMRRPAWRHTPRWGCREKWKKPRVYHKIFPVKALRWLQPRRSTSMRFHICF